jgi:UDP-N-acetylmuramate--alanine ligase
VEWDHVDCYPTPAAFAEAFRKFVGQIPPEGMLVACADDPGALGLRDAVAEGARVETYGLDESADWQARSLSQNAQGGFDAEVWHAGEHVADLSLPVPGRHNVRNALAALAVADWHHIRPRVAAKMLRDFHGAGRRFEFIGEAGGVIVIDDYAHHPTEVSATLSAARLRYPTRRIWAVFQPHTYSRTQALLHDYEHSFDDADRVLLLDIYAAREKIDLGMHSMQLLEVTKHEGARYVGTIEAGVETLMSNVEPDDVVITMSAGDGNLVGTRLLAGLRQREGLL